MFLSYCVPLLLSGVLSTSASAQLLATDSKILWEGRTVRDEVGGTVKYSWAVRSTLFF